ncbi:hypothetical protein WKH57_00990 [Niallia taxi]|uniref:hypothetical protein n=1 Tax=Niallia taxi TaxID=2499688 RepID=UPI0031717601
MMSVVHSTASFFFLNCLIVPAAIINSIDSTTDPPIANPMSCIKGSIKSGGNAIPPDGRDGVVCDVAAIDLDVNIRKLMDVPMKLCIIFLYCFLSFFLRLITSSIFIFIGKFTFSLLITIDEVW